MSISIKTEKGILTVANTGGSGGSSKVEYGTSEDFEVFKQDESVPVGTSYVVTDDYDENYGEIYDDQERVIGTWFGKPLYRKLIYHSSIVMRDNTWNSTGINISDFILRNGWITSNNCTVFAVDFSKDNNGVMEINAHRTVDIGEGYFVIEYTKAGD